MATRRTEKEKLKLIADYEMSGLSMAEWCKVNGISKSTFAVWIKSAKSDGAKTKKKARFVEVALPTELQEQPKLQARSVAEITVEYKAFKITIPENIDAGAIGNILKAVVQADV